MDSERKVLMMNAADNVLVCCQSLTAGEAIAIDGQTLSMSRPVEMGHKIARYDIGSGEEVRRYGVSIGSATQDIKRGEHVHTHNLKSDYTASHHRDVVQGEL